MDDLIFEGRNKSYGAYQLRMLYDKHSFISMTSASLLFLSLMLLLHFKNSAAYIPPSPECIIDLESVLIPMTEMTETEKILPSPARPAAEQIATIRSAELIAVPDATPTKDPISQADLLNPEVQIGLQTQSGIAGPLPVRAPMDLSGSGIPEETGILAITSATATEEYVEGAQIMAEYPGGAAAMKTFIQKHILYPEIARGMGIEGVVVLRFIVEKDGRITNVEVIKDPGGGLGKEAVRVFSKMPKWNPAYQGEHAVRLRMSAPVKFTLQ